MLCIGPPRGSSCKRAHCPGGHQTPILTKGTDTEAAKWCVYSEITPLAPPPQLGTDHFQFRDLSRSCPSPVSGRLAAWLTSKGARALSPDPVITQLCSVPSQGRARGLHRSRRGLSLAQLLRELCETRLKEGEELYPLQRLLGMSTGYPSGEPESILPGEGTESPEKERAVPLPSARESNDK